jgi:uncharacterized membrane protein
MTIESLVASADVLLAGLIMALSLPLILNKIPPNKWYGVRIPKAFHSDENWYQINQYGGKVLFCWSLALGVIGFVKLFAPFEGMDFWSLQLYQVGPAVVCMTGALIQILVYASKV